MTPKEVYIPVPVEERLPEKGEQVFLISSREMNLPKRVATYFGGADEKEFKRMADHWLEKKEVFILTKEDLKDFAEKARRYYIDNTKHVPQAGNAVYVMGSTDDFFNDWLNTQK